MQFFGVWMSTMARHEVERARKRLHTRMYHVQRSERQLEERRLHYVDVRRAFEHALKLLTG